MSQNAAQHFLRKKLVDPIKQQLTQGVSPRALALSCALGFSIGIFPIIGSTTLLCFIAGVLFKLNQPAIQAVNYLAYPVQIALVPVFVRVGERIFNAQPVPLYPTQLVEEFSRGPGPFLAKYGEAGLHGIAAWGLTAPVLIAAVFFPLVFLLGKMKKEDVCAR